MDTRGHLWALVDTMTRRAPGPCHALGVALLLSALTLLGGCSSGGNAPSAPPTTQVTRPTSSDSTSSDPTSSDPTSSDPSPASPPVASGPGRGSDGAYCAALQAEQGELSALSGAVTDREAVQRGVAALQRIQDVAPEEVRPAWGDFIAFAVTAALGAATARPGATDRLRGARATIAAHAGRTCGVAPTP